VNTSQGITGASPTIKHTHEGLRKFSGKERPILFSPAMAQAVHQGRKSQTRRTMKPQPVMSTLTDRLHLWATETKEITCPFGKSKDRLWVREAWLPARHGSYDPIERGDRSYDLRSRWVCSISYRAEYPYGNDDYDGHWRPGIHMFRWMSRILTEITEVRAERLRDISEADAIAEGVSMDEKGWFFVQGLVRHGWLLRFRTARECFFSLWESINGAESLAANPWLWAISFRKLGATEVG